MGGRRCGLWTSATKLYRDMLERFYRKDLTLIATAVGAMATTAPGTFDDGVVCDETFGCAGRSGTQPTRRASR